MTAYYVLKCLSPIEAEYYVLEVGYPDRGRRWHSGRIFSEQDVDEDFHPPVEPIEVGTEKPSEGVSYVYPEYASNPIPLMTHRLVEAFRAAGVDNLQTYETILTNPLGNPPPPKGHYLAVNIVGRIAAADLQKSETNPEVGDTMISMDFHSLSIDESKTRGALMFRLAENISAVLVHERVKNYVEASGIDTLTWLLPEEWAG